MISTYVPLLLIVEDNDEDYAATLRVLRTSKVKRDIQRCTQGDDALNFLYLRGKYVQQPPLRPAVILLDLNLPGTDGREVLEEVKRDPKLKSIPVVVMSTSSNPIDIETSYQNGANSYIVKEVNFSAFKIAMQIFEDYWFRITTLPNEPF